MEDSPRKDLFAFSNFGEVVFQIIMYTFELVLKFYMNPHNPIKKWFINK
ncbi:hypothetical protein GIHI108528_15640 [Gillisia hiemivivida]